MVVVAMVIMVKVKQGRGQSCTQLASPVGLPSNRTWGQVGAECEALNLTELRSFG